MNRPRSSRSHCSTRIRKPTSSSCLKRRILGQPAAWRLVGDRDGNFATIGSQQSRPEAALVEKIINSVDARLMNECLVRGIDPTSAAAPATIRQAVSQFFEGRQPATELGGTLQGWSQSKQLEQSHYITLAVTEHAPELATPASPSPIAVRGRRQRRCPIRSCQSIETTSCAFRSCRESSTWAARGC